MYVYMYVNVSQYECLYACHAQLRTASNSGRTMGSNANTPCVPPYAGTYKNACWYAFTHI